MKNGELLEELTIEEKVDLCSGTGAWHTTAIDRLDIPSIMMTDGPHGLRKQLKEHLSNAHKSVKSTCYPTASAVACSWDESLVQLMADSIAKEALAEDVSIVLGPGVNIKRSPLCGRNFEYFSEDPYLSGKIGASFIRGIESNNISSSLKHFLANNQETRRQTSSSDVDTRTLRELYLKPFEIAIKEGVPSTVMAAYNKLNGTYCAENEWSLTNILRDEWGYDGVILSDWGATHDRGKSIQAGLNLEMPQAPKEVKDLLILAIKSGEVSVNDLDERLDRLLTLILNSSKNKNESVYDVNCHHNIARKIARESAVMLKNNGALPINKKNKILVVGELASIPRYQGSGSSHINPTKLVSLLQALDTQGINYDYQRGYSVRSKISSHRMIKKAIQNASSYDNVIVCVGLTDEYEWEGRDRKNLSLPKSHDKLVSAMSKVNKRTSVVLFTGSPVLMPWRDNVDSILNMNLAGQAVGDAAYDLLFGDYSPSGKLSESYPLSLQSTPCYRYYIGDKRKTEYREGIYVGYRYYEKANVIVNYPFGFGLSYNNYKYSNFDIDRKEYNEAEMIKISFDISNSGNYDSAEIAQVYVKNKSGVTFVPEKELKAFIKVSINKNNNAKCTIDLPVNDLKIFNVKADKWQLVGGDYEIIIASSSQDIKHVFLVKISSSEQEEFSVIDKNSWYYNPSRKAVTEVEYNDIKK